MFRRGLFERIYLVMALVAYGGILANFAKTFAPLRLNIWVTHNNDSIEALSGQIPTDLPKCRFKKFLNSFWPVVS
jgi:hypothetical protein